MSGMIEQLIIMNEKKIKTVVAVFMLLLSVVLVYASVSYKTVYNPFTSKLDYVLDEASLGNITINYTFMDVKDLSFISPINLTSGTYDGNITSGSLKGYEAANDICDSEFSGSHLCTTYEVLNVIKSQNISYFSTITDAWIANGPPGYTADANDCLGYTSDDNTDLGAFWAFDEDGGGIGWLTNCANAKYLACCGAH